MRRTKFSAGQAKVKNVIVLGEQFSGTNGFLGSRGSLMLDVVFLAMFAIVPVLAYSIYLVRSRRRFELHKRIQITLGLVLLLAVTAFEIDMRFFTDWRERAVPSRYYDPVDGWNTVWSALAVHLFFAIPTPLLWIFVIARAIRNFPHPLQPGAHSRSHIFWAWLATVEMGMTALTGWIFYWLAFVA